MRVEVGEVHPVGDFEGAAGAVFLLLGAEGGGGGGGGGCVGEWVGVNVSDGVEKRKGEGGGEDVGIKTRTHTHTHTHRPERSRSRQMKRGTVCKGGCARESMSIPMPLSIMRCFVIPVGGWVCVCVSVCVRVCEI